MRNNKEFMPRGFELGKLFRALVLTAGLNQADEVDASASKLREATLADNKVNPIVVDGKMSAEQLAKSALEGQGLSLGPAIESPQSKVNTLTPTPLETSDDLQVSAEGEDKPALALATATPVQNVEDDVEQVGGGTAELPPVIEAYYMRPAPEVVVLPGSNIRAEPGIQIIENGITRDVEVVITTSGDPNEVFALNGDPVVQPDGLWLPIRRGTLGENDMFIQQTTAGTGWVREDRTDNTQYSRRLLYTSQPFSPEQRASLQQQAFQVAAENGLSLSVITQFESKEPGYETVWDKPVAVDTAGNIVMFLETNMAGEGAWSRIAPLPFPGGIDQAVFLLDNAATLSNPDAAAIAEASMAPYERLVSTMPEGATEIYMEPVGDLHYIWALAPDGLQLGLWNMTPDGGEWAELRIDSPNRETMANPEVFDQIPEHIKRSYLYSESLGGYFRVQRQRDGQNAIEVYMPRLAGVLDVSTNTTSEGWVRLYDALPGGFNFFGFGDFSDRERPANYGGIVEGRDEELQSRYQAALTEMTNLMYEFSNDRLNPSLSPGEIEQRRIEGNESFELVIPNDWYMWRRNMDRTVEELTQQNPLAFSTQTFIPNGVNFIMLSDMSNEEAARWMTPISFIDRTNVGVSLGYSISENGRLNVFIFTMNEGGPAYSSISIDSNVPNALAKLVKHTRPNPPAQEVTGHAAHEPFKWAIANALGVGTSTANQEQLVRTGYSPLFDVSPSDNT